MPGLALVHGELELAVVIISPGREKLACLPACLPACGGGLSPEVAPDREALISSYRLIGDTRTAALVCSDGAIDWLCLPRFDAEPVFGRLVGRPEAGTFRVGPAEHYEVARRRYDPGPTMLETTWRTEGSALVAVDAMVSETSGATLPASVLVRRLEVRGQPARVEVLLDPVRDRAASCGHGAEALDVPAGVVWVLGDGRHPRFGSSIRVDHGGRDEAILPLHDVVMRQP